MVDGTGNLVCGYRTAVWSRISSDHESGGNIYPRRLAALSGSLTLAAVLGSVAYPPLMGIMERSIGLRGGMIVAAILGVPSAVGVVSARILAQRSIDVRALSLSRASRKR